MRSVVPIALLTALSCGRETPSAMPGSQPPTRPSAAPAQGEPPAEDAEVDAAATPTCEALPGWRYERIELPPEFAPTLPAGVEVLWFAPGMFRPDAADYFTYAFSVTWHDDSPNGHDTLRGWLHTYYDGLMTAVAGGADRAPARPVEVRLSDDLRTGAITMSDEFTGGGDLDLALRIDRDAKCMQVLVTAHATADNWTTLESARACLCGDG